MNLRKSVATGAISKKVQYPSFWYLGSILTVLAVLATSSVASFDERVVFVTSTLSTGNLGGVDGADATCNQLAGDAGLSGDFKAWLSDSTHSPAADFRQFPVPYVLVDGTKIADDWSDLVDGTLDAPIRLDETGAAHDCPSGCGFDALPHTNTNFDGTPTSTVNHCSNWTSDSGNVTLGATDSTDSSWTLTAGSGCFVAYPRYCFEQTELAPTSVPALNRLGVAMLTMALLGIALLRRRYRQLPQA